MSEFQVISKAKDLAIHTFKLTSNCNHFPKKYRYCLVDKMQNKSLEIYESLFEANDLNLASNRGEREALQTKAVNYCDELLFFIELSMELGIINPNSSEYWTKMVTDVKWMTLKWRTTDRARIVDAEANKAR